MAETSSYRSLPRRLPLAGVILLLVVVGLAVIYFRLPYMHRGWPPAFHWLFWIFEGVASLLSVAALSWQFVPAGWTRRLPTISRNRVFIPREGIGYLLIMGVLFVGSSLTQSNTLMLVFAAMAGPFIVNGWITYTMLKNVQLSRRIPPRAMAGELFSAEIDLLNRTPVVSMWMMVVQDNVVFQNATSHPTVLFTRVPPKAMQTGHYQLRLMHRGRYFFGPLQATSRFPLGLIERGCIFREPAEMLIYPKIGRLSPAWKRRLIGASELVETSHQRQGIFDDEFHHLREYRPGDNPRAIHWRSSARRNTLIVREYQQNREHHLLLLLDVWQAAISRGATPRTEQLLSLAATIALEHRRECRGATLTVVGCGAHPWRWEASANSAGLESLFDLMAEIEPTTDTKFVALATEAITHMAASTRVVALSPRNEKALHQADALNSRIPSTWGSVQWLQVDDVSFAEVLSFDDDLARPHHEPPPRRSEGTPASLAAAKTVQGAV